MNKGEVILVIGKNGSGKSKAILKYLINELSDGEMALIYDICCQYEKCDIDGALNQNTVIPLVKLSELNNKDEKHKLLRIIPFEEYGEKQLNLDLCKKMLFDIIDNYNGNYLLLDEIFLCVNKFNKEINDKIESALDRGVNIIIVVQSFYNIIDFNLFNRIKMIRLHKNVYSVRAFITPFNTAIYTNKLVEKYDEVNGRIGRYEYTDVLMSEDKID